MRMAIPALAIFSVLPGGCAGYSGDAPIVAGGPAAPQGTTVALRQPVEAGAVVLTPMAVAEDSRCTAGTQCVWAGRVVVTTRIDGAGWRETIDMTAGRKTAVRNHTIMLVDVMPAKTGHDIAAGDYRFTYSTQ